LDAVLRGTDRNDHRYGRKADDDRFVLQAEKRTAARNRFCIRSRGTAPARMAGANKTMEGKK